MSDQVKCHQVDPSHLIFTFKGGGVGNARTTNTTGATTENQCGKFLFIKCCGMI